MNATRSVWSRPELIVLVRGRPEEAVLNGCKVAGSTSGWRFQFLDCKDGKMTSSTCTGICSAPAAS